MAVKVKKKKKRAKGGSSPLDKVLRLIPGYDPFETAEDCYFDEKSAQLALDFFPEVLTHVKGELKGEPFILEPWEQAIIGNLFGWKRQDGTRRYREALIYLPRKNGKTCLAAGIVNYVLFCDGEPGAEIYSGAADRDQAMLVFAQAEGMVRQEPLMDSRATIYKAAKSIVVGDSSYKAISAEANTKHGYNTHLAIIDELHAQPNRDLVDVLITSTGARRQPLIIHITTADFERESICNEKLDYAEKVRDGIIDDVSFLPVIYSADLDADWTDPKVWARVNPNLGVSLSLEYLERECKRAQETPSFENTFKRLHLNMKTEQDVRWLSIESWDACGDEVDAGKLKGKACWAGLDLSTTSDLSVFALIFRPDEDCDKYRALLWCWVPGDSMEERYRKDRVPYPAWERQGFIEKTEGNVVDYDRIREKINEISKEYSIQEIAFDPWNATQTANDLGEKDGFEMVEFRQGFRSLNEPSKELERLVISNRLAHGGNPVLQWAASNVSIKTDPAGNIKPVKPDKQKSIKKIDPIVALIMALGRAMIGVEQKTGSVYDDPKQKIWL